MSKINENEKKVLTVLASAYGSDLNCFCFETIINESGLDLKQVRRACRSLKKKGLAEFYRGLFDEDGMAAGSGYCCSEDGNKYIEDNNL